MRSAATASSWTTEPTRRRSTQPSATGARCSKRFAEDHARVYLRPDATANAELRRLAAAGVSVGAFTPKPEPLARVAAAHLGVARRLERLEAGPGALERLLDALGRDAVVVGSLAELQSV